MTPLGAALREKFTSPEQVLEVLGLDEKLLAPEHEIAAEIVAGLDEEPDEPKGDAAMATEPNIGLPVKKAEDEEPAFLKKANAEDRKAFDAWLKGRDKRAKDESEEEEKKKAAEAKDAEGDPDDKEKKAADAKRAKDADPEPDDKEKVKGMDAALVERTVKLAVDAATAKANQTQRDIREAERAVFPYIGHLTIACDSAEEVYATTLAAMLPREDAMSLKNLPLPALKIILKQQPLPGQRELIPRIANDSAGYDDAEAEFMKMFPDAKAPMRV